MNDIKINDKLKPKNAINILREYLIDESNKLKNKGVKIEYKKENENVVVIIEPRKHFLLEAIIRNSMHHLGKDWNLHIFGYELDYIRKLLPNSTYQFTKISANYLKKKDISKMLINKDFWKNISEENILIFYTDSFILNKVENLDKFMKYPFIGGAYRVINEKNLPINSSLKLTETNDDDLSKNYEDYNSSMSYNYSISGGFTFRKKSVILKCLKYVSLDMVLEVRKNKKLNNFLYNSKDEISESSYYQNALDILGIEIPDYDTCNEFCCVLLDKFDKNSFAICNLNKKIINKNSKEIMEYIIIKKFYH